jgi:WD40 repeat protein
MLLGPEGKSLILSSGKGGRALAELNFETRKVVWSHPTTPGIVALARLGADRFASVGWDHHVRVWKRTPPTAVQPPPPLVRTLADRNDPAHSHTLRLEATPHGDGAVVVDAMVHLPQSGLIVTRGHDKVQVVSAMDLTEVRSFGPELSRLSGVKDRSNNGALAVTEDEKTVVVTDDEGSLLFFDIETGEEIRRLNSPNRGADGLDVAHQEVVWQILLDEDKGRIYTTDDTAQLHEWDLESGEVLRSVQLSGIGYELVMSPDGGLLAVLTGVGENIEQMFLTTSDLKAEIVFQVARHSHNTVGSFSADGEKFYRAFLDGRVMALYPGEDARVTNEILFRVPGQIVDVQVTEDGEMAWVGSAYGPVPLSLWDLETRQPVWLADGSQLPVWRMVVVADDRVVCLCKDNKMRMYVRSAMAVEE